MLLALVTEVFVEIGVMEQDVDDARTHIGRVEGLGAQRICPSCRKSLGPEASRSRRLRKSSTATRFRAGVALFSTPCNSSEKVVAEIANWPAWRLNVGLSRFNEQVGKPPG